MKIVSDKTKDILQKNSKPIIVSWLSNSEMKSVRGQRE